MSPEAQEIEVEVAVLGAALSDPGRARALAWELQTHDFTSAGRARVFHTIGQLLVDEREISPRVVIDELGPETSAELKIDPDSLESWSLESPAIEDEKLFRHYLTKLQRLRVAREYTKRVRAALVENPIDLDDQKRAETLELLQEAELNLGRLGSLNGRPTLKAIDFAAAAEGVSAIPWVLTDWLAAGDVVMLAGEGGIGKSWTVLDLCFALCNGSDWLGGEVRAEEYLKPQRVLYVDQENRSKLVDHRANRWIHGHDIDHGLLRDIPFRYLVDNDLNLDDDTARRQLVDEIDAFRPDWIILDSFVRFHRRNENDNGEMSQFFTGVLRPLGQRAQAGIIAMHHMSKGTGSARQRTRGASDLYNQVDVHWSLEEHSSGEGAVLRVCKSRWGARTPPLRLDITNVNRGKGVEITCRGRADDVSEEIMDALCDAGEKGILRKVVRKMCKDAGMKADAKAASRHLTALHNAGKIRTAPDGKETRIWDYDCAPLEAK